MLKHVLLALGVIALGALIAYRAYVIPFTHDEASTWLNYRNLNVWSCYSNAQCWGTANNHWLNTFLMQRSSALFGDQVWALRLPNVLAGLGYFICAALICGRYLHNYALRFAGLLLLCAHVYLLDFFSLARGYGLMTCGVIWGIYGLLRYTEAWSRKWLIASIVSLVLGILGNFTGLIAWAAIGAGWLLYVIASGKYSFVLRHGIYWLGSAVLLFLLLQFPIRQLAGASEFAWGSANPFAMATDLMQNLLYGVRYFEDATYLYTVYLVVALIIVVLGMAIIIRKKESKNPVFLLILLLVLNVVIIATQQQLMDTQAPVGRKSIYLIPFVFGIFVLGLGLLRNTGTASFLGIIISLAFIGHLLRTLPMHSTREWFYDAYYPQLLSDVLPKGAASDSITMGSSWIFSPGLQFYQQSVPLPIGGLVYQRPLVIDSTMQFYFVEQADTAGMSQNGFDLEKRFGPFLLFKNQK